jgi:hypothetical protein
LQSLEPLHEFKPAQCTFAAEAVFVEPLLAQPAKISAAAPTASNVMKIPFEI